MEKEKKQLGVAFIVVLVAIVMVSAIGIIAMSNKPVVLQGQIEATEIRISGKLPGRIDTFLVREAIWLMSWMSSKPETRMDILNTVLWIKKDN